ncbi:helix-turn-helix domain-containing protein [Streptomyces sp. H39-S7]|uniref:helix-turn-helix domain-containing protein n=1 Tax=Streptomyces sp. H39-S7 TaxID=3004357 RepID=UPI0022AED025|nr:helix-turn-helix domain-containing protein [Streptomyces sp. H39-S7]MCZ4122796.1 helix-turn-helix domain-containing protein [Streptomyces sp. H39-S7]
MSELASEEAPLVQEAVTTLSTEVVPARERFEWWMHRMRQDVMPTVMTSDHADCFRGRADVSDLSASTVVALTFSPLSARRGPALIRHHDPEDYHLFVVHGSPIRLEQSGNVTCLSAGDMALFDTSHPLAADFLDHGRQQRLTLMRMPRASLPLPGGTADRLLGNPLRTRTPTGALLGQFLSGFRENSAAAGSAERHRLGRIGFDLAVTFLASHIDAQHTLPVETREHELRARIDAFIEHNLGDQDLRPATIATHHRISVRTLHQLFQGQPETVSAMIRRRRLERCKADLLNLRLGHHTIGDISTRWGFRHPADFSRAFRAAYGVPPRDLRHQECHGPRT